MNMKQLVGALCACLICIFGNTANSAVFLINPIDTYLLMLGNWDNGPGTDTFNNTIGIFSGSARDSLYFNNSDANNNYAFSLQLVPVPTAIWLFSSGLLGLVGLSRRKA